MWLLYGAVHVVNFFASESFKLEHLKKKNLEYLKSWKFMFVIIYPFYKSVYIPVQSYSKLYKLNYLLKNI